MYKKFLRIKSKLKQMETKQIITTKNFNDEEMSVTGYISTKDIDRYGDIVIPSGMDNSSFRNNPVVLFGHKHDSIPIARSLWEKADDKGVKAKIKFDTRTEAKEIYRLMKEGFLNAFSIGFKPIDAVQIDKGGTQYNMWELLEFSIVPIPANAHALAMEIKNIKSDVVINRLLEDKAVVKEFDSILAEEELEAIFLELNHINKKIKEMDEQKITETLEGILAKIAEIEERVKALETASAEKKFDKKEFIKNIFNN